MAVYRILCEALTSIKGHAHSARDVNVTLTPGEGLGILHVRHAGPGVEVEAAIRAKRVWGLMSIRLGEIIGGSLEVTSRHGLGTTVTLLSPCSHWSEADGKL